MAEQDDFEIRRKREEVIQLKLAKLAQLEEQMENRRRFPHRYSRKLYPWQREWINCREKTQVLTAANQVGKSQTMRGKCLEYITNEALWPVLWPEAIKEGKHPNVFWYCYPIREMASSEFFDKWVPDLPPKDDPVYAWEIEKTNKFVSALRFIHKDITVYFKTYGQGAEMLQAGTAYAVFCDEEIYEELIPELQARVSDTNGYLIFGFTATIGQPFWKNIVEDRAAWPTAWIRQISLYDCQVFEDGTQTKWTDERIQERIAQCNSKAEVLRRIYGRFVKDEGLRYPTFDRTRHVKPYHPVPADWVVYAGVDYGSGTPNGGHPSAIIFVAVNPALTQLRIIRSWRGDGIQTTAEDVIDVYEAIAASVKQEIVAIHYDYAAADLGTVAGRRSLPFQKADKSRERGIPIVNALFKTDSMVAYEPSEASRAEGIPDDWLQAAKLAQECESLGVQHSKSSYGMMDDLVDTLRYAVVKIPLVWERTSLGGEAKEPEYREFTVDEIRQNPEHFMRTYEEEQMAIEEEIAEWNSIIGG